MNRNLSVFEIEIPEESREVRFLELGPGKQPPPPPIQREEPKPAEEPSASATPTPTPKHRRIVKDDDDDWYDPYDGFIDDSEVSKSLDMLLSKARQGGFFVHEGGLEAREESDDDDPNPDFYFYQPKKRKRKPKLRNSPAKKPTPDKSKRSAASAQSDQPVSEPSTTPKSKSSTQATGATEHDKPTKDEKPKPPKKLKLKKDPTPVPKTALSSSKPTPPKPALAPPLAPPPLSTDAAPVAPPPPPPPPQQARVAEASAAQLAPIASMPCSDSLKDKLTVFTTMAGPDEGKPKRMSRQLELKLNEIFDDILATWRLNVPTPILQHLSTVVGVSRETVRRKILKHQVGRQLTSTLAELNRAKANMQDVRRSMDGSEQAVLETAVVISGAGPDKIPPVELGGKMGLLGEVVRVDVVSEGTFLIRFGQIEPKKALLDFPPPMWPDYPTVCVEDALTCTTLPISTVWSGGMVDAAVEYLTIVESALSLEVQKRKGVVKVNEKELDSELERALEKQIADGLFGPGVTVAELVGLLRASRQQEAPPQKRNRTESSAQPPAKRQRKQEPAAPVAAPNDDPTPTKPKSEESIAPSVLPQQPQQPPAAAPVVCAAIPDRLSPEPSEQPNLTQPVLPNSDSPSPVDFPIFCESASHLPSLRPFGWLGGQDDPLERRFVDNSFGFVHGDENF
eukprot:c2539_g1_i2.p1 GENE.c2539_g1_i2~~c2539_g1_i2.p1  ORF type:complete len:693 (+),score=121.75 c2539_g1_i2:42-2081(+)